MTVRECIAMYKQKYFHKITRIWLCPQIVHNIKLNKEYVLETSVDTQLDESLLNAKVTKHWLEPKECICMTYKQDDF